MAPRQWKKALNMSAKSLSHPGCLGCLRVQQKGQWRCELFFRQDSKSLLDFPLVSSEEKKRRNKYVLFTTGDISGRVYTSVPLCNRLRLISGLKSLPPFAYKSPAEFTETATLCLSEGTSLGKRARRRVGLSSG